MELQWIGIMMSFLFTVITGAIGYGRLKQQVEDERDGRKEGFDLVRRDVARVDEKVENLTDYLLRKNGDK